jgi:hypothetical protein
LWSIRALYDGIGPASAGPVAIPARCIRHHRQPEIVDSIQLGYVAKHVDNIAEHIDHLAEHEQLQQ